MIYWDPHPVFFTIPGIEWPVRWYGLCFAAAFIVGFPLFVRLWSRYAGIGRQEAARIADRLTLYVVVGTLAGARLGHFLFYEDPADYLRHPWEMLEIWKGGLASHGGALGIVGALILFGRREKIDWVALLDLVAVPAALGAALIRIGNFINQELLGTVTDLPWGVVFGHPEGPRSALGRHPVVLYEAVCYLAIFALLWRLSRSEAWLRGRGRLAGVFLVWVFTARLWMEMYKVEQSAVAHPLLAVLKMGQWLSLPAIGAGCWLLWQSRKRRLELFVDRDHNRT
jgi:prolipoprotein diacylglyceryl transferase